MKRVLVTVIITLMCFNLIQSQTPAAFDMGFTVSSNDSGSTSTIFVGLDPLASEDIDQFDQLSPPLPPAGIFDAAFSIPADRLLKDIRLGAIPFTGMKEHILQYQPVSLSDSVLIVWNAPTGIISINIQDLLAGFKVDATFGSGPGSLKVPNLENFGIVNKLKIKITYDGITPVELTSFSGSVSGSEVNLVWQTATEINNYGFEIERNTTLYPLSTPMLRYVGQARGEAGGRGVWELIGFVPGHGNSSSPNNYSFSDNTVTAGNTYLYRLKQIDNDGSFTYSEAIEVALGLPTEYELNQNYPNPFNPSTKISFSLPESGMTNLVVFNLLGEEVAVLLNDNINSGFHSVDFNAGKLQSGIYFYKLATNNFVFTRKMMLIK